MALIERIMARIEIAAGRTQNWPPVDIRDDWARKEAYRWRFENDRDRLIQTNPRWHGKAQSIFTPIPLAYEMGRLSSSLLFSEQPRITHATEQDAIDELASVAELDSFLQSSGEYVAIEGRSGLRIVWAEDIADFPVPAFVHGDQVVWDERYGHYIAGGAVVTERVTELIPGAPVYRFIEEHGKGYIERSLYKGTGTKLGRKVALNTLDEFAGLEEEEETGLDLPTLIKWDNVPGGRSDLFAAEDLLDRIDEAESLLVDKMRKSIPLVLVPRQYADEEGKLVTTHAILTGDGTLLGELAGGAPPKPEVVQPGLQSGDHIAAAEHLMNLCLMTRGYSLATWGRDQGGSADSGKALKLRQARTLLTKAGKDRMSRQAVAKMIGIALAWRDGASKVSPYLPEVEFGDGLPEDQLETAEEVNTLSQAEAISTEQKVRRVNPRWDDARVKNEVAAIESASRPDPLRDLLNPTFTEGA